MLDAQKDTGDIDVHRPVPIRPSCLGQRLANDNAGIVDKNIQSPASRTNRVDEALPLVFIAYVKTMR